MSHITKRELAKIMYYHSREPIQIGSTKAPIPKAQKSSPVYGELVAGKQNILIRNVTIDNLIVGQ